MYEDIYCNSKKLKLNQRSPNEELTLKRKVQYFVIIAKNQVDLFVLMCEVLQDL